MANIQTLHERASALIIDNKKEEAIDIYNQIIEQDPQDEVAYSQLMDLYYDDDKLKYYITRANLNIVQNHLEHAINDCKKAINVSASEVLPHLKLAKLYAVTGKNLKAIDEFCKVLELDPKEKNSYFDLISLYIAEKSTESALNIALSACEYFNSDNDFKNTTAKLYFDLNNYDKALDYAVDNFLKAKIYLQKGDNISAKEILDIIEKQNNKKEQKVQYLGLLAQYYYNEKDFQKTLETLEEYRKADKPTPVYFQMKALTYEALKDDFNAHFNWGYCAKHRDKIEEAIMQFQSAHNMNPKNKDVMIELAKLYEANKEEFVSMEFWQKIYELDGDKNAGKILSDFYKKQGDIRLAKKYAGEEMEMTEEEKKYEEAFEEDEGLLNKIISFFSKK